MNIGTIVEGPSDRMVIKAVLNRICPGDHRFFDLQPQGSDTFGENSTQYGKLGGGWKGVRRWCHQTQMHGASLELILTEGSQQPLDLLVIQVDADIIREHDLQDGITEPIAGIPYPCPPITENIRALEQIITRWLDREDLPEQIVFAIPSQDMENWTFAAHFPEDDLCKNADYECVPPKGHRDKHPGYLLTLKKYGKYLLRQSDDIDKPRRRYRPLAIEVGNQWQKVCEICEQARAFDNAVRDRVLEDT